MRRVIFIESNTTGSGMVALRRANELGWLPCFVTRSPGRYPQLAEIPHDLLICDTNTPSQLAAAIAGRWPDRIAGVTTTSEFYLPAVARVAAELGLPGNPWEVMVTCRDKAAVRRVLDHHGVGQPAYVVVGSAAEAGRAVARLGLPCVVKPVDGSGSQGVLLCHDTGEVRHQVSDILANKTNVRGQPAPRSVLLEQYVTGPEFSVETFSDAGTVTCVGITAKTVGSPPSFVEARHIYPAPLPAGVADELAATAERALKALGFAQGPAHTEVRWTASGPAIIEVNARLAGGMLPELVRLATGVDLLTQQLHVATGRPVELTARHRSVAGIHFITAPERGVLLSIDGLDRARSVRGVQQVHLTVEAGQAVAPPRDAYGRVGFVIAKGRSAATVERILDRAVAEIAWEVAPE
ncbi:MULTISPECIES: ATP-grasp domain-containing protein [unclassified Micromonospora]|uniref:ATP-grasp domain-containing protein n=1 Tax=unclassified Micromonospora TaxID=2617518 RepID=UPI0022B5FD16|nr:ATP-grasp domain-containing protein [Micromonospora sp. WMMC273]MCZ7476247.1 ATP-grasp domain-containing protein [Micromonospora sp. WMMC273]